MGVQKESIVFSCFHLIAKLMQQLNPEWFGCITILSHCETVSYCKAVSFNMRGCKKALTPRQHANLFRLNHNLYNTKHRSEAFTNRLTIWRYFKSPVIYLTRILNNEEEFWNIIDQTVGQWIQSYICFVH